ncbi:unnamed protein product [Timema podura]|uniref:Ig-like domain-containing protein n=1 Tax=Timema podura TaxID=61482 RepID=A0ABN7NMS7_TIMPD|nr:unnamed protein product [Timema podura]
MKHGVQVGARCHGKNSVTYDARDVNPPLVSLQLGNTLNPDDIKEGDDVYFECNIRANPKEHKIVWLHNKADEMGPRGLSYQFQCETIVDPSGVSWGIGGGINRGDEGENSFSRKYTKGHSTFTVHIPGEIHRNRKVGEMRGRDEDAFAMDVSFGKLIYSFLYFLGGVLVMQNMSSGVILSTHSLVLQGVTRHNGGRYTCMAANARGETTSEPVALRVQCE